MKYRSLKNLPVSYNYQPSGMQYETRHRKIQRVIKYNHPLLNSYEQ